MANVSVILPSFLAKAAGGVRMHKVSASTLKEVLEALSSKYDNTLRNRFFDKEGRLTRLLNIYVNGKNYRFKGGLECQLEDGDKVEILPAVAGG